MQLTREDGTPIVCPSCKGLDFIATSTGERDGMNLFRGDCINEVCKSRFEFEVGTNENITGSMSEAEQAAHSAMSQNARSIPLETQTLWTRAGELVTDIQMPVFRPRAEIVIWGERFFWLNKYGKYAEGLAYIVPVQSEVEPEDDWPDGPIFDDKETEDEEKVN